MVHILGIECHFTVQFPQGLPCVLYNMMLIITSLKEYIINPFGNKESFLKNSGNFVWNKNFLKLFSFFLVFQLSRLSQIYNHFLKSGTSAAIADLAKGHTRNMIYSHLYSLSVEFLLEILPYLLHHLIL